MAHNILRPISKREHEDHKRVRKKVKLSGDGRDLNADQGKIQKSLPAPLIPTTQGGENLCSALGGGNVRVMNM